MDAVGGYFELALSKGEHYHKNALRLNTARNCLEYILRAKKYEKIYIPYYTCEVLLEPITACNIDYEFYFIDGQLEPQKEYMLQEKEAFLYTNYFGLKDNAVKKISNLYRSQLIVDNSQAFYSMPMAGVNTFYSARKFFGVPDGAYLYTDKYLECVLEQDVSYNRMKHLLKRIEKGAEAGYNDFVANDNALSKQAVKKMSLLTGKILTSIDYDKAKDDRINNYRYLDRLLKNKNEIRFELNADTVPMVYPFLSKQKELRQTLIQNKIFAATYWPNVSRWLDSGFEIDLMNGLIPLPIDQRYGQKEMQQIVNILQSINN